MWVGDWAKQPKATESVAELEREYAESCVIRSLGHTTPSRQLCFWLYKLLAFCQIKGIWLLHIKQVEDREGNNIMSDSLLFIGVCLPLPKTTAITCLWEWAQFPGQAWGREAVKFASFDQVSLYCG